MLPMLSFETDAPLEETRECELCIKAPHWRNFCATTDATCQMCDFNLGHNKKNIPFEIGKVSNLLGEGCTVSGLFSQKTKITYSKDMNLIKSSLTLPS